MGLLDDIIGSAAAGGNVSKSPAVALLSILANRAGSSGGLGGLLGNSNSAASSPVPDDQSPAANVAGGLRGLVQRFQQSGFDGAINSWVGTGPNQPIAPNQLHQALGPQTVDELSQRTGLPHQDLLSRLSQDLPAIVDRLTPEGRIPDQREMSRWQSGEQFNV